jgi:hypothetical protein
MFYTFAAAPVITSRMPGSRGISLNALYKRLGDLATVDEGRQ